MVTMSGSGRVPLLTLAILAMMTSALSALFIAYNHLGDSGIKLERRYIADNDKMYYNS